MESFYQIVTKQEIDGNWVGFFVENSEIYKTEDDACKAIVDLANKHISKRFNDHLIKIRCLHDYVIQPF